MKRESVDKETDMRKARFTEEKIIAVLVERERGMGTAEVCRKHGISPATLYKWKANYKWKAKFGGGRKQNPVAPEGIKAKGFCSEAWTSPRRAS